MKLMNTLSKKINLYCSPEGRFIVTDIEITRVFTGERETIIVVNNAG